MSRAIPQLVSAALNPNAGLSYLYVDVRSVSIGAR